MAPAFEIDIASLEPPRLRLVGELDLAAAPLCEEVIEPLCERRTTVELDLGELTFIDSTGLRALVRMHRICDAAGGQMLLLRPPSQVARVIEMCDLDKVFNIEPDGLEPGGSTGPR